MDDHLLDVYPLARKAFEWHDNFYARYVGPMPDSVRTMRDRAAEIIDSYAGGPLATRDAMIVAALISVDPLPCHRLHGKPEYGDETKEIVDGLISAAKTPEAALPAHLAPIMTALSVATMEQTITKLEANKLPVSKGALPKVFNKIAAKDDVYLPHLDNRRLRDLYEVTQFILFYALERAAVRPPPPPDPDRPVF